MDYIYISICIEILNLIHGGDNHARSKDSSTSETLELY